MNFADKIYCINLNRRPDRWVAAHAEFEKHHLQVERFAAIDGKDFRKQYVCDNANNGCTLSHYFIIERAKLLGLKSVMIFEDDVELHPEFTRLLSECLQEIDDWHMLYFGASHREPPLPVPTSGKVLRLQRSLTTHGYIIRSSMFGLITAAFPDLHQPVDCYFAEWQRQLNVYITNPPLAWQRKSYSDITGREMHYPWLQTNAQ